MSTFIKIALFCLASLASVLCTMSLVRRVVRLLHLEWLGRQFGADFGIRPTFHFDPTRLDDVVARHWFKYLLILLVVNFITRWTFAQSPKVCSFGRGMWKYVTLPWLAAPLFGLLIWKAGLPLLGDILDWFHAPSWRVITSWLDNTFSNFLNLQWLRFWSWKDTP